MKKRKKQQKRMKKIHAIGMIVLLIGAGFSISIQAKNDKSDNTKDQVEIEIELCGFELEETSIKCLDADVYEEFTLFLKDLEKELNDAKTKLEATEIIDEALSYFYEIGMIPDSWKINKISNTILGKFYCSDLFNRPKRSDLDKFVFDKNINAMCLIVGETEHTIFLNPRYKKIWVQFFVVDEFFSRLISWANKRDYDTIKQIIELLSNALDYWRTVKLIELHIKPFITRSKICFGFQPYMRPEIDSDGWVYTIGINGIKIWDNIYRGDVQHLLTQKFPILAEIRYRILQEIYYFEEIYTGVLGFTGIKINHPPVQSSTYFFLGTALFVRIKELN